MMTDEELDSFEDACKATFDGMYGYSSQQYLELIAMIRQARAERDWLVENMPNNVCPEGKTECADRCPTAGGKACYSCVLCWLDAAKEATCPKN